MHRRPEPHRQPAHLVARRPRRSSSSAIGPNEKQNELRPLREREAELVEPADWTDQGYATDSLHGQRVDDDVVLRGVLARRQAARLHRQLGTVLRAPADRADQGRRDRQAEGRYTSVRGCDLAWRPDGLELAIVQRADAECGGEGQIALVDPKKPTEQRMLRPGRSPSWSVADLGTE